MMWIAVGIGGALGSMARHGVNQMVHSYFLASRFPHGVAVVNLLGCLVIGVLAGLLAAERIAMPIHWREFVFVGLLGGFTTFSSFGLDTFTLVRAGATGAAMANVVVHVGGGVAAVTIGYWLGNSRFG